MAVVYTVYFATLRRTKVISIQVVCSLFILNLFIVSNSVTMISDKTDKGSNRFDYFIFYSALRGMLSNTLPGSVLIQPH